MLLDQHGRNQGLEIQLPVREVNELDITCDILKIKNTLFHENILFSNLSLCKSCQEVFISDATA